MAGFFDNVKRGLNPPSPPRAEQPAPTPVQGTLDSAPVQSDQTPEDASVQSDQTPEDALEKLRKAELVQIHEGLVDGATARDDTFELYRQLACSDSRGRKSDLINDIRLLRANGVEPAAEEAAKPAEPNNAAATSAPVEVAKALAEPLAPATKATEAADRVADPVALYVGCAPRATVCAYFDELVHPYTERVAQDVGADHYLLIKYNEGPKRVAALVAADVYAGRLALPPYLVVDRRHPAADALVGVLARVYPTVVERCG